MYDDSSEILKEISGPVSLVTLKGLLKVSLYLESHPCLNPQPQPSHNQKERLLFFFHPGSWIPHDLKYQGSEKQTKYSCY